MGNYPPTANKSDDFLAVSASNSMMDSRGIRFDVFVYCTPEKWKTTEAELNAALVAADNGPRKNTETPPKTGFTFTLDEALEYFHR